MIYRMNKKGKKEFELFSALLVDFLVFLKK